MLVNVGRLGLQLTMVFFSKRKDFRMSLGKKTYLI